MFSRYDPWRDLVSLFRDGVRAMEDTQGPFDAEHSLDESKGVLRDLLAKYDRLDSQECGRATELKAVRH
jgi:hypothetical protein